MITITSNSILVTLDLLNRIDFNKNQVFYYDYDHAYQILNIVKEKNGSDDNYELILGGASNLKFKVCDDEIQFSPRKVHISHEIANKISGMPPDISMYSF